jgi:hypothetical protein
MLGKMKRLEIVCENFVLRESHCGKLDGIFSARNWRNIEMDQGDVKVRRNWDRICVENRILGAA